MAGNAEPPALWVGARDTLIVGFAASLEQTFSLCLLSGYQLDDRWRTPTAPKISPWGLSVG